jgi:hypothetical protein
LLLGTLPSEEVRRVAIALIGLAVGVGSLMIIVGLYLTLKQQVVVDTQGNIIDFKISTKSAHLRTRSAALAVIVIGAALLALPVWKIRIAVPRLNITGKILLHDGKTISGIQNAVIGILPTKDYATFSLSDGTFSLDIPAGAEGESYQALVHVSNTTPPLFVIGVVQFTSDGKGRFEHTFTRSR